MDGAEFFSPGNISESYDPKAFERFKEQIKKNAAIAAQLRKSEQKQKHKEDRLVELLMQLIKNNQKSGLLMLVSLLLKENIPALFILSIVILGNEELFEQASKESGVSFPQLEGTKMPSEFSLVAQFGDATLPLKVKAAIDSWGAGMLEGGSGAPFRILETALDLQGNVKPIVNDCAANVLGDFLQAHGVTFDYRTMYSFCEFIMRGIMLDLKRRIENQKQLGEADA